METRISEARVARVLERALGAPAIVRSLAAITGGATKHSFVVDALAQGQARRFVLQLSTASGADDKAASFTPRLSPANDARLMAAAEAAGVAVPRVRAILAPEDGLGQGYLSDFVDAEALGRRIVHDPAFAVARAALTSQCGRNLAAIHRLPTRSHPYLRLYPAQVQIDAYADLVRHYAVRSPALAFCFGWARAHLPRERTIAVVHGDFRMGNLMTDANGLRCVLDWESAHLGDPMQDLGWLCMHTWRFGGKLPVAGVGSREDLFAAYEAAGGGPVDPTAVRFWEAWGNVKWAVAAMRKGLRWQDGVSPTLEQCAIGRRMEEPLWDFFQLITETES